MGSLLSWDNALHARAYDVICGFCDRQGLRDRRAALVADLEGTVLELGCGTGFNFEHYPSGARVFASDLNPGMLARAAVRATDASADIHLFVGDAMRLPLPADSVDTVVWTLLMCSVPHPEASYAEVLRVLKPGGRVRFVDHVRDHEGSRRQRIQDRVNPLWRRFTGGCNCNRDLATRMSNSGLDPANAECFMIGRAHVAPHISGEARAR